jgi:hypothetical protein
MGRTIPAAIQGTAQNALGSADLTLMPTLTCDPRQGLKMQASLSDGKQKT